MHDKLMQKLKQKGKKLNPLEQKAKMGVIKELSDQAGSMMGDKVKSLKKVSIASDSKQGLEEGLSKAQELIHGAASHDPEKIQAGAELGLSSGENADEHSMEKAEELMHDDLDNDGEEGESEEHQAKVHEDCKTPEDVDAKINELMALKEKMKRG